MNNLSFLVSLLAYTITNPKIGRQILQAKYQSWQDSRHSVFNYAEKKLQLDDIIKTLFPESSYSIEAFRKGTDKLQNHIDDFFNKLKNETYPSKKKPYPLEYTLDNTSGYGFFFEGYVSFFSLLKKSSI